MMGIISTSRTSTLGLERKGYPGVGIRPALIRDKEVFMANAAKDKMQGKFHEVKGAATGNSAEEVRGKLQGAKGDAEHAVNKGRREADRKTGY